MFTVLPCDDLSIAINLLQYKLISRDESPCRNDYPPELMKLLKTPLKPEYLYNSIHAPKLPYDHRTCDDMCVTAYWLPQCNCYMSEVILFKFINRHTCNDETFQNVLQLESENLLLKFSIICIIYR